MTKEEVEKAFGDISPYYAYKQGLQDGAAYNEDSFRREAAKDILAGLVASGLGVNLDLDPVFAVKLADALIKQLKEK